MTKQLTQRLIANIKRTADRAYENINIIEEDSVILQLQTKRLNEGVLECDSKTDGQLEWLAYESNELRRLILKAQELARKIYNDANELEQSDI